MKKLFPGATAKKLEGITIPSSFKNLMDNGKQRNIITIPSFISILNSGKQTEKCNSNSFKVSKDC